MSLQDATLTIRTIGADEEHALAAHVSIRNAATPTSRTSLDELHWERRTFPSTVTHLLAIRDGLPVGTATTGRIWMHEEAYERFWLGIWVLAPHRGHGIGTALYRGLSDVARAAGKTGFQTELSARYETGHRFLARRGFVEVDRSKQVRLALAGHPAPDVQPPPGIALTTLAVRPDLLPGVHAVAVEAFADIPSADAPVDAGTLESFAARDVHRPGVPLDAFVVAVDEATGAAAGYASLIFAPGSTTVAFHDMTAVRRAFRGRGLATALKQATIAWALDHGLEALETSNDEHNAAMRRVNARLGYAPIPDLVGLHGPLAPSAP